MFVWSIQEDVTQRMTATAPLPQRLFRWFIWPAASVLILMAGIIDVASAQSWTFKNRNASSAIAVHELPQGGRVAFECPSRSGGPGPSLSITRDLVLDLDARWAGYASVADLVIGPQIRSGANAPAVPQGSRGGAAFVPIPATGWVTNDFFGAGFDEILGNAATSTLTLRVRGRGDVAVPLSGLVPHIGALREACSQAKPNLFVLPVRRWIDATDVLDRLRIHRPFLGEHVGFFATAAYGNPHAMTPVFERLAGPECAGLVVATDLYYTENWEIGREEERIGLGFRPSSNLEEGIMKRDCPEGGRVIIVGRWDDDENNRVFLHQGRELSFEKVEEMLRFADTWSGNLPELSAALDQMAGAGVEPAEPTLAPPARGKITDDRAGIGWKFNGKVAIAPLETRSGEPPVRGVSDLPDACLAAPGLTSVSGMDTATFDQVDKLLDIAGFSGSTKIRIECGNSSTVVPIVTEVSSDEGKSWQILDTPNKEYVESVLRTQIEGAFRTLIEKGSFTLSETDEGNIRLTHVSKSGSSDSKSDDLYTIAFTTFGARTRLVVRVSADSDRLQDSVIEAFRRAGLRVPFDPGQHDKVKDWPVYVILDDVDRVYFRQDAAQSARRLLPIIKLNLFVNLAQTDSQLVALSKLSGLMEGKADSRNKTLLEDDNIPEYALRLDAAENLP